MDVINLKLQLKLLISESSAEHLPSQSLRKNLEKFQFWSNVLNCRGLI
jgi:hypothetical protein